MGSFIIGVIMSIAALVIAEIYILAGGGKLIALMPLLKLFGVMVLSVFAGSSMVFFITSFFKSNNAFATASTIIGTLIGFLTEYMFRLWCCICVQTVIKIFPISHQEHYSGNYDGCTNLHSV